MSLQLSANNDENIKYIEMQVLLKNIMIAFKNIFAVKRKLYSRKNKNTLIKSRTYFHATLVN